MTKKTKKKSTAKKARSAAKWSVGMSSQELQNNMFVACMVWVFTILSIVYAGLAYWRFG